MVDDTLPPENDIPQEDQPDLNNPDDQDHEQSHSSRPSPKKTYDQLKNLKNLRGTPKPPLGTPAPTAGVGSAAAGEGATAGTGVAGSTGTGAAATSAGTAAGSTGAAASGAGAAAGTTGAAGAGAAAGGAAAGGAAAGTTGAAASGAAAGTGAAASGGGIIAFFSTPPGWVVLAIILLLLIILLLYLALQNQNPQGVSVTLTKTAPAEVKNDENIPYKLSVSYTGNPNQIIVTDPLPANTEFVSAGQNAQTLDASGNPTTDPKKVRTVKWTLSGGGSSGTSTGGALSCNVPSAPSDLKSSWTDWTCNGIASDHPLSSGWYQATGFGCGTDFTDPNDNCIGACGNPPGLCDGLSGPDCQRKVKYFAADKDRYGCFTNLQVTNPATGKSVVVITIDQGPSCPGAEIPNGGPIINLGGDAPKAIGASGNYEPLHVQPVDKSVPLGPVTSCSATNGGGPH